MPDIYLLLLFTIGAISMRSAGCIVNDIWDRKIDARVRRTAARPLASGRVSLLEAILLLIILLSVSLVVLMQLNKVTQAIGVLSVIPVMLYPLMKRITNWPQAFLGMTFGVGALMGYAAVTGGLSVVAILIYIATICWIIGYDTIYACQDARDDEQIGVKSTALLFDDSVVRYTAMFYSAFVVLMFIAFMIGSTGVYANIGLGIAALQMVWQLKAFNAAHRHWSGEASAVAPSYSEIFKSNFYPGLFITIGLLIG